MDRSAAARRGLCSSSARMGFPAEGGTHDERGVGRRLALGCATLGQLLVWEWRSETYILKQQGHYFDIAHAAYSPDGAFIATGADDNKLKVSTQRRAFLGVASRVLC